MLFYILPLRREAYITQTRKMNCVKITEHVKSGCARSSLNLISSIVSLAIGCCLKTPLNCYFLK